MNTPDTHSHDEVHDSHEGTYFIVFICLAALTLTELITTYIPYIKIPLLVVLSTTKAILVVTFYMHLRWERRFYPLAFTFPIIIAVLIALALQQLVR